MNLSSLIQKYQDETRFEKIKKYFENGGEKFLTHDEIQNIFEETLPFMRVNRSVYIKNELGYFKKICRKCHSSIQDFLFSSRGKNFIDNLIFKEMSSPSLRQTDGIPYIWVFIKFIFKNFIYRVSEEIILFFGDEFFYGVNRAYNKCYYPDSLNQGAGGGIAGVENVFSLGFEMINKKGLIKYFDFDLLPIIFDKFSDREISLSGVWKHPKFPKDQMGLKVNSIEENLKSGEFFNFRFFFCDIDFLFNCDDVPASLIKTYLTLVSVSKDISHSLYVSSIKCISSSKYMKIIFYSKKWEEYKFFFLNHYPKFRKEYFRRVELEIEVIQKSITILTKSVDLFSLQKKLISLVESRVISLQSTKEIFTELKFLENQEKNGSYDIPLPILILREVVLQHTLLIKRRSENYSIEE